MPESKPHIKTEELLRLRDEEKLTYSQISTRTGMSKGNISKRLTNFEKEKIQRGLPTVPNIDLKRNPMSIQKALDAVQDLEERIKKCDRYIKSSKLKVEKLPWEKLRTKLLSEKRRWLSFGTDLEFQMAQNYQVKEILHIIMNEIEKEDKALAQRILHRIEAIGSS